MKTKIEEVESYSDFLHGFASAMSLTSQNGANEIDMAAFWLKKLSQNMCGQGFIGCKGGPECSSSHK